MKLKLDENLGERGRQALISAGHDVCTVPDHGLHAARDPELLARCVRDGRALVTLDMDFANPLIYPPHLHHGVAVLRLPVKPKAGALGHAVTTLIRALRRHPLDRQLWIVETNRIRVYLPES